MLSGHTEATESIPEIKACLLAATSYREVTCVAFMASCMQSRAMPCLATGSATSSRPALRLVQGNTVQPTNGQKVRSTSSLQGCMQTKTGVEYCLLSNGMPEHIFRRMGAINHLRDRDAADASIKVQKACPCHMQGGNWRFAGCWPVDSCTSSSC